jgi:hypothetical protein
MFNSRVNNKFLNPSAEDRARSSNGNSYNLPAGSSASKAIIVAAGIDGKGLTGFQNHLFRVNHSINYSAKIFAEGNDTGKTNSTISINGVSRFGGQLIISGKIEKKNFCYSAKLINLLLFVSFI